MTRIGEVIEATTTRFIAGAYTLLESPPFGALVRAQTRTADESVYGLVYDIRTGSKEPGGRATVRGYTYTGRSLYDQEIYDEHPDLAEVLQTEFAALTVGFTVHNRLFQYLPPQPPPVHYSIYPGSDGELAQFTQRLDFLRTLLFNPQIPSDELVAAVLRTAALVRGPQESNAYLLRAGRELALLLKDDHDRLTAILRRIKTPDLP